MSHIWASKSILKPALVCTRVLGLTPLIPWFFVLANLIFFLRWTTLKCTKTLFLKIKNALMFKLHWHPNWQTAKDQDYFEILEYLGCITLAAGCPLKRQGDPLLWSIRWAQEWSNNKKRSCTWILFFSCLQENCTGMSVSRFFKVMEFRRWIPESCKL